jgi:hypothetical protein
MSNLQVHHTCTKVIQSEWVRGWEFGCDQCGYRAHYLIANGHDMGEFEILELGDPEARHCNTPLDEVYEFVHDHAEDHEEEIGLPAEIVEQIEAILGRFDFDY